MEAEPNNANGVRRRSTVFELLDMFDKQEEVPLPEEEDPNDIKLTPGVNVNAVS